MAGNFVKHVATLAGGTLLAQIVNFAALPIITRLYSPSDFGVFALFTAIAALVAVFTSLKYEHAIIAATTNEEAENCVRLVFVISITVASVLLLVSLSLHLSSYVSDERFILLAISSIVMSVVTAWYQALYYMNNRQSMYMGMTRGRVYAALVASVFSITYGYTVTSYEGLMIASVLGVTANFAYLKLFGYKLPILDILSNRKKIIQASFDHSRFPKYLIVSTFVGEFGRQLNTFVFSKYFGSIATGSLGLHNKVVSIPSALIGNAVGDVFKRDASEQLRLSGNCKKLFLKTSLILSIIAFVPTIILILFGPGLFVFVFGDEWRLAGEFSQILSVVFFLGFIVSPISTLIYLEKNQKYDLYIQLFLILILAITMTIAVYQNNTIYAVIAYSISFTLKYILEFVISLYIASGYKNSYSSSY